jgi:hypothetical protein
MRCSKVQSTRTSTNWSCKSSFYPTSQLHMHAPTSQEIWPAHARYTLKNVFHIPEDLVLSSPSAELAQIDSSLAEEADLDAELVELQDSIRQVNSYFCIISEPAELILVHCICESANFDCAGAGTAGARQGKAWRSNCRNATLALQLGTARPTKRCVLACADLALMRGVMSKLATSCPGAEDRKRLMPASALRHFPFGLPEIGPAHAPPDGGGNTEPNLYVCRRFG